MFVTLAPTSVSTPVPPVRFSNDVKSVLPTAPEFALINVHVFVTLAPTSVSTADVPTIHSTDVKLVSFGAVRVCRFTVTGPVEWE